MNQKCFIRQDCLWRLPAEQEAVETPQRKIGSKRMKELQRDRNQLESRFSRILLNFSLGLSSRTVCDECLLSRNQEGWFQVDERV